MRIAKYYGVYPSVIEQEDVKWIYLTTALIEADNKREQEQRLKDKMKERAGL